MRQRGRHSSASVDSEALKESLEIAGPQRVIAPECLNEDERREWDNIVNSLPPEFFQPSDIALLCAFCTASALHKEARQEVALYGLTLTDERGRARANPAAGIVAAQATSMANMAQKLRLAPSSRSERKPAGTGGGAAGIGNPAAGPKRKPWETPAAPTPRIAEEGPPPRFAEGDEGVTTH